MPNRQVICFGEILWDIFPDRKVIGGAPLNVASRLHSYHVPVDIISCIGNDAHGDEVLRHFEANGISSEFVQRHPTLATGVVNITLDAAGVATYDIEKPVAWDAIGLPPQLISEVKQTPFFLFGSLAVRGAYNRQTLQTLLEAAQTILFDVNLRPPHFDISMVYELMQRAHFIKLNDEELETICNRLGCEKHTIEAQIQWLATITRTNRICVTRGGEGAILLFDEVFFEHPGYKVVVKDTVGAGDSFLATLINELLLNKKTPKQALKLACAVGALVASKEGANCVISEEEIDRIYSKA